MLWFRREDHAVGVIHVIGVEGVQKSFYLNLRSDLGDELTIARLS